MKERLFIAIPLPIYIKKIFTKALTDINSKFFCPMTPVKEDAMHITLAFLGDTDTSILPELKNTLNELSSHHMKFSLTMHELGCFPNPKNPRTLLTKIDGNLESLISLYEDVTGVLDDLRLEYDRKQFKPHMTLARIRDGATPIQISKYMMNYTKYQLPEIDAFEVCDFRLFKSELTYGGPIYTVRNISTLV